MKRSIRLVALELGLVTVIALTLAWPGRAWVQNCTQCMPQPPLSIPLGGVVLAGSDTVPLAGQLELLPQVQVGPSSTSLDLHATLSTVLGEGCPSGALYEGRGTIEIRTTHAPPRQPDPLVLTFSLHQRETPHQRTPLFVGLIMRIGEDGTITEAAVSALWTTSLKPLVVAPTDDAVCTIPKGGFGIPPGTPPGCGLTGDRVSTGCEICNCVYSQCEQDLEVLLFTCIEEREKCWARAPSQPCCNQPC